MEMKKAAPCADIIHRRGFGWLSDKQLTGLRQTGTEGSRRAITSLGARFSDTWFSWIASHKPTCTKTSRYHPHGPVLRDGDYPSKWMLLAAFHLAAVTRSSFTQPDLGAARAKPGLREARFEAS